MNDKEHPSYKHLWVQLKIVFKRKLIALKAFFKKKKGLNQWLNLPP